jgi:hypothetical protein
MLVRAMIVERMLQGREVTMYESSWNWKRGNFTKRKGQAERNRGMRGEDAFRVLRLFGLIESVKKCR